MKMDEVDAVVASWAKQRPDLDFEPLEIFSRLLRIHRHFSKIRRRIYAQHGLETWEFEMLAALRREPSNMLSAGQLMKDTFVSSGTITNRIDRMLAKKLVTRKVAAEDGRVVQVSATERGIEMVDAAMVSLLETEREILAQFGPAKNAREAKYLREILLTLSEMNAN